MRSWASWSSAPAGSTRAAAAAGEDAAGLGGSLFRFADIFQASSVVGSIAFSQMPESSTPHVAIEVAHRGAGLQLWVGLGNENDRDGDGSQGEKVSHHDIFCRDAFGLRERLRRRGA